MTVDTRYLNGTRFILAIWVGIVHFFNRAGSGIIHFPLQKFLLNGGAAVDGFMVITGFLMAFNYISRKETERPSLLATKKLFWLRRIFRLYPVYFVVILLGYFTFESINDLTKIVNEYFYGFEKHSLTYGSGKQLNLTDLWMHLTFLHGVFPSYNMSIIGPAWSLSTEIQFYAIFPFLFLFIQSKSRSMVMLFLSAILYVLAFKLFGFWGNGGKIIPFGAPSLIFYKLMYFLVGINLAGFKQKVTSPSVLLFNITLICLVEKSILSVLLCAFIVILMASDEIETYTPKSLYRVLMIIKEFLSGNWGKLGADLSYSFYIIHSPILSVGLYIGILLNFENKIITAGVGFLIFLIITLFCSWVLFVTVEKPFIKIGRDFVSRYKLRLGF